jgi:hypothetical protein
MPTLVDIFCGRGGWTIPALRRGWTCIGYDSDHTVNYPGQLIHARAPLAREEIERHNPTLVVLSPPCEEYARWYFPWIKGPPPDTSLLGWALHLRLHCPKVVECNHASARWFPHAMYAGPYALWGDLPILLPAVPAFKQKISGTRKSRRAMIHPTLADWIIHCAESRGSPEKMPPVRL